MSLMYIAYDPHERLFAHICAHSWYDECDSDHMQCTHIKH